MSTKDLPDYRAMTSKIVSRHDTEELFALAEQAVRRRMHLDLHGGFQEPCQIFLNAILEDSYIRPHAHYESSGVETLVILEGAASVVIFDDFGTVVSVIKLSADFGTRIAQVPPLTWHTVVAEQLRGALIFEAKQGPFSPCRAKRLAPWAPPEKSTNSLQYLANLKQALKN